MSEPHQSTNGTQRALSKRHVQMIAIGGTIGTGLFLGAGSAISKTGPSILLIYAFMGLMFFLMMRAIGELLYADPDQHTFIAFITKYVGPATGYFSGWFYWFGLVVAAMTDLSAVTSYVQFWFPHLSGITVQVGLLVLLGIVNIVAVKFFGEAEYWFATIKIIAILAMIATGIFLVATSFQIPASGGGGVASFGNILDGFTLFPNGGAAFLAAFPMVFFAFLNIEFVGITTAETKNPRSVLPKAINTILLRILFFYLGVMVVIMSIVHWQEIAKTPDKSPFVTVFELVGFKAAAAVINFVVLTSAASALNSGIYSAGRHFYQLATEARSRSHLAAFAKITSYGIPARAIVFNLVLIGISPFLSLVPQIANAFLFLTGVTSNTFVVVYILTMVAHWRYRQSADFMADGFKMPWYHVTNPLTILFFAFIYVTLLVEPESHLTALVSLGAIALFGSWSWWRCYRYHRSAD